MSTNREEVLVTELVSDLYNMFDRRHNDPPISPVVFSRIIMFIRDFTNNPNFVLGEEKKVKDKYIIIFKAKDVTIEDDHSILSLVAIHKDYVTRDGLKEIESELNNPEKCEGAHLLPINSPWDRTSFQVGDNYYIYLFVQWWG